MLYPFSSFILEKEKKCPVLMESRCPCTRDGGEEDGPEDGPEDDHKNGVWKLIDGWIFAS